MINISLIFNNNKKNGLFMTGRYNRMMRGEVGRKTVINLTIR